MGTITHPASPDASLGRSRTATLPDHADNSIALLGWFHYADARVGWWVGFFARLEGLRVCHAQHVRMLGLLWLQVVACESCSLQVVAREPKEADRNQVKFLLLLSKSPVPLLRSPAPSTVVAARASRPRLIP